MSKYFFKYILYIQIKMAPRKGAGKGEKKKKVTNEVITKECTINVHKRIHGM